MRQDHDVQMDVQDSLGGNAKTMIIANVLPTFAAAHETLSTLQFASRAKHIRNKAIVNEDTSGELALLQRELHRLRRSAQNLIHYLCTVAELVMHLGAACRPAHSYRLLNLL